MADYSGGLGPLINSVVFFLYALGNICDSFGIGYAGGKGSLINNNQVVITILEGNDIALGGA